MIDPVSAFFLMAWLSGQKGPGRGPPPPPPPPEPPSDKWPPPKGHDLPWGDYGHKDKPPGWKPPVARPPGQPPGPARPPTGKGPPPGTKVPPTPKIKMQNFPAGFTSYSPPPSSVVNEANIIMHDTSVPVGAVVGPHADPSGKYTLVAYRKEPLPNNHVGVEAVTNHKPVQAAPPDNTPPTVTPVDPIGPPPPPAGDVPGGATPAGGDVPAA